MKLLDYPFFAGLKACMSGRENAVSLDVHLACFSLKSEDRQKDLYKQLVCATAAAQARARERSLSFSSMPPALGDASPVRHHMDIAESAAPLDSSPPSAPPTLELKTLCQLITALNVSFPDFDFSCVRGPLGGAPCYPPTPPPSRRPHRPRSPTRPARLPCTPLAAAAARATLCACPAWRSPRRW